jgi:hypothetical protein
MYIIHGFDRLDLIHNDPQTNIHTKKSFIIGGHNAADPPLWLTHRLSVYQSVALSVGQCTIQLGETLESIAFLVTLDEGETSHHSISFPLHPLRPFSYSSKINGAEKDWKYARLKSTWLSTWLQSTQLTEFFIFFRPVFLLLRYFPSSDWSYPSPFSPLFFSCVPGYKEWTHHIDLESEWEIERERDEKWWASCHAKLPNDPTLTKNGAAAECNEISFKLWLSSPFVIR